MARLAANRPWNVTLRMVVSADIGARTSAERLRAQFGAQLSRANTSIRLANREGNPFVRVANRAALFASDATIELSTTLEAGIAWDTQDVATAFFNAVKLAGNDQFSVTRLVQAIPPSGDGCGAVDLFGIFQRGGAVYRVCIEYSPAAPGSAATPPPSTSLSDSVVATAGSATIRDSTNAQEVGIRQPSLGDRVPNALVDPLARFWDGIPLSVVVVGGAVVVLVGLVAVAYVVRTGRLVLA